MDVLAWCSFPLLMVVTVFRCLEINVMHSSYFVSCCFIWNGGVLLVLVVGYFCVEATGYCCWAFCGCCFVTLQFGCCCRWMLLDFAISCCVLLMCCFMRLCLIIYNIPFKRFYVQHISINCNHRFALNC